MKSITINDLPNEILLNVLLLARVGKADPQIEFINDPYGPNKDFLHDPNDVNPNEEYPLYKSARLVCKRWKLIATPLLFETLILLSHSKSWEDLVNIAGSPYLARHVRTIHLATIKHLPAYDSRKRWERSNEEMLEPGHEYKLSWPNGGPLANISHSPGQYFLRYQRWHRGEKIMARHFASGTAPKLRLNLLTNLEKVKTVGHYELAVVKREYNRKSHSCGKGLGPWRDYRKGTRREVETLVQDSMYYGSDVDASHLERFLCALNASAGQLRSLALRDGKELLRLGSRFDTARQNLSGLRRLEIKFSGHEWRVLYICREEYPISPWLNTLKSLEELKFTQPRCYKENDIFRLIGGIKMPKLTIVCFEGIQTTYINLKAFVDLHRASICSLSIIKPHIEPEDWVRFCAEEQSSKWRAQNKTLKLTEIDLYGLQLDKPSGAVFEET